MLDKDFIFAFDLCNRMTHCPCDTMPNHTGKEFPHFNFFRMLFFIYPKTLEIKRKFRL